MIQECKQWYYSIPCDSVLTYLVIEKSMTALNPYTVRKKFYVEP